MVVDISNAEIVGRLDHCGDTKHPGFFGRIICEFNSALDLMIGPMIMSAEYIERISRDDIPEIITHEYRGDINEIKNNMNFCI
ncbi:MAG: hypothetical protein JW931_03345 [Methanomicrobiaceae archaeon]|nr:hypothetical protein [Methanomicrobiaceae archaeon]